MSTLLMHVRNGILVGYDGGGFESFSKDGLTGYGNDWEVTIIPATEKAKGKIICHCEREYKTGPMSYDREFKLQDGTIGLSGGHMRDRHAFFRKALFQNFLDEMGIKAIRRANPDQTYRGPLMTKSEVTIYTNGHITFNSGVVKHKVADLYYAGSCSQATVSGSTWVLINGTLYTLMKDITRLKKSINRVREEA